MPAEAVVGTPPILRDAEIEALLAQRIDVYCLSRGMVVGITDAAGRRFIAHGHGDTPRARPIDADTLFEIGSITKVFTALVLADMVDNGEAALNEPVEDFLSSGVRVPTRNGRPITLIDLASHRAGLPRMPANFGLAEQTDPDSLTCRSRSTPS
jgi:D-alanyl-D-alanine-carboxypeptidase/D-alanyl-D-alanine-endopeptidase